MSCPERVSVIGGGSFAVTVADRSMIDLARAGAAAAVAAIDIADVKLDLNRSPADFDSKPTSYARVIARVNDPNAFLAQRAF